MLPRLMWINKSVTLKQVHHEVFRYMRAVIAEWIDWTDPNTSRTPKEGKPNLRKSLIKFPYSPDQAKPLTRK